MFDEEEIFGRVTDQPMRRMKMRTNEGGELGAINELRDYPCFRLLNRTLTDFVA